MTRRALQFASVFAVAAGLVLSGLRVNAQCPKAQADVKAAAAVAAPDARQDVLRQQRREVLIDELGLPLGLLAEYALDGE